MTSPRAGLSTAALRNVEDILRLEQESNREVSRGERLSVAVTSAVGTPWCAAAHLLLFLAWTGWNAVGPADQRFDPYPFGFLTMFVSMEGVILAIFVLITQNRMSAQTDRRDHLNLQVNLLAEQEMTMVLRMLDRVSQRLEIGVDSAEQTEARKLMEDTNIYELMEALRRKFE